MLPIIRVRNAVLDSNGGERRTTCSVFMQTVERDGQRFTDEQIAHFVR